MSSSSFAPRSATHRRPGQSPNDPIGSSGSLRPVIDEAPKPRPIFQLLAFGCIIFLALLQFLPATHFRDPSDPFRKWIPSRTNLQSSSSESRVSKEEDLSSGKEHGGVDGSVHIVSWIDCEDLRLLAVLVNSTLSSSRHPESVYFHFFTPKGNNDKVSFYKLKVLFPHSNIELLGQKEVKEAISRAYSMGEYAAPIIDEIVPFVIPIINPSLSKFIYVSPNVIVKGVKFNDYENREGRIEELNGISLNNYAIAIAEDCSKRLSNYVNLDVLDAIQRSASKPWVSHLPYAKNSCMPELDLVLIDAKKLEKDLLEAIIWWSRVLNTSERGGPNPAIVLAIYNKHLKLPLSWRLTNFTSSDINSGRLVLRYGGTRKNACSAFNGGTLSRSDLEDLSKDYLPLMSDRILGS